MDSWACGEICTGWAAYGILKSAADSVRGNDRSMPNHFSAIKRDRITDRRTRVNRMRKTRLRHSIRSLRRLLEKKDAAAANKLLPKTFSVIDRASKMGVIKDNTAARYKSRLHIRLKAIAKA